ncbi:heavy metal translocating P-type ATPase [Allorhodopirellula heiligendammensis]|uniref:Copper-importing P-type ATPase A n=1 Tax=Allorhodopirellula heiligendammensis TaxID=2714739 RepID=A0A5C6BEE8_9BACT|nr:heavy metal translocating P-type ATPase metal-binding domain-containing protein [Allorhodopirellula heiligendammensis]TWU10112.1 putative copper-importing P-type ATPase A [Allorhodopirellula heiligendammensis]
MTPTQSPAITPTRISRPCIHCGEPTDSYPDQPSEEIFCCNGCRGAYELIHGWGLESYYGLRDQLGRGTATRVNEKSHRYDRFDSEEFLGTSTPRRTDDGLLCSELAVHGLHCAACAWLIENAARHTPGWNAARVKMSDHTVRVVYDPATTALSQIARLLDRLGYELAPLSPERDSHFQNENRRHLIRIAVAGFCAANAMWIAVALYAGDLQSVAVEHRSFLALTGTLLGVASVLFPGRTFFVGAFASLKSRVPHMDLPVALGLAVGTVAGVVNVIVGGNQLYFDSLAVLVFLLLIGRWIQFHQQHRAAKAVDLLLRITPRHAARVNSDGTIDTVLVDILKSGDCVRVDAGESIPVDGEVVHGESLLDRSLLTGESVPVEICEGGEVSAGTLNLQRPLDICVHSTGRESRIGRVMQSVEEAMSDKIPIVQFADSIGGVFVVAVTLLAIVTFLWWLPQGWAMAASNATALLIVACPCALALATPLAIAVSLGRAAKHRVLIRDGTTLQQLARGGRIWFDKTGTLTTGQPDAWVVWGASDVIAAAAAVEQHCRHPVAAALVRLARRTGVHTLPDAQLDAVYRQGVLGHADESEILVGSPSFLRNQGFGLGQVVLDAIGDCTGQAASPIVIARDGIVEAVVAISDAIKPEAAETLTRLRQRGWEVGILSGDHPEIVNHVADLLGVDRELTFGGLSPEEKLAAVRGDKRFTTADVPTTVMVGDGANDAAALAAADVGIAVRGGVEVSLQAAPVFIADDHLHRVDDLIDASRRTDWLIRTALAVSLLYNLVAVALAMSGKISPLVAAILMPLSSVSVLAVTLMWPTYPSQSLPAPRESLR